MGRGAARAALMNSLAEVTRKSRGVYRLDTEAFFHNWLRQQGAASFFLFKKNLDATNIQLAELSALVRTTAEIHGESETPFGSLHVRNTDEFIQLIVTAASIGTGMPPRSGARAIVESFGDVLLRTVVVDYYWCSATLLAPPGVQVDVERVAAESGYVHSCGDLVWVRNLDKAHSYDLIKQLAEHLERNPIPARFHRYFSAFAHEDFTEYDRELSAELRDGLDTVKLWVDKFYLGDQRLPEVLNSIREQFPQLVVPRPGDFRATYRETRRSLNLETERCLWLIMDRRALRNGEAWTASEDRYLICYEQLVANDNPMHIFDENKPAWRSHTTLPHTLAGAMVSLAAPSLPAHPRILDPFVGTGTTLFEASRIRTADLVGMDIDRLSPLLIRDNATFFSHSAYELDQICSSVKTYAEIIGEGARDRLNASEQEVLAHFTSERSNTGMLPMIDDAAVTWLTGLPLGPRLLFYLCLRTSVRNAGGLVRGGVGRANAAWNAGFGREVTALVAQIDRLIVLRNAAVIEEYPAYTLQAGRYSRSATASAGALGARLGRVAVTVGDVQAPGSFNGYYDLVIADPPYGFNTDENWSDLAETYVKWLQNVIAHLASPGQIVMCLPERSRVGREAPSFARAEFVLQMLNAIAQDAGRELYAPHGVGSGVVGPYSGRYYWESERALRRTIIHVHVR